MARSFKETAHLNTDKKKYGDNYDKIFGKKSGGLTDEMKTELQSFILTISSFNAAEGSSWSSERSARRGFKSKMIDTISSWNVTKEEFEAAYNELTGQ